MSAKELSEVDEQRLNFYRVSWLHAGLILGRPTTDAPGPEAVDELQRRSAACALMGRAWETVIRDVGGRPRPVWHTYQSRCAEIIGEATRFPHVLALSFVFERRMARMYRLHLRSDGMPGPVRKALGEHLASDAGLPWVTPWMHEQMLRGRERMGRLLECYAHVDKRVARRLAEDYGWIDATRAGDGGGGEDLPEVGSDRGARPRRRGGSPLWGLQAFAVP